MPKRYSRQRKFCSKNGLPVRSPGELEIANFLEDQGIRFTYEPPISLVGYRWRPDFFLDDYNIYIEYFGMNERNYRKNAWNKRMLIEHNGYPLISLYGISKGHLGATIKQGFEQIAHQKFPQKQYFDWRIHPKGKHRSQTSGIISK